MATLPMQTGGGETPAQRVAAAVRAQKEHKAHLIRTGQIRPPVKTVQELHENIVVVKQRVEVPIHLYLEEQSEPTPVSTLDTQTDAFLEVCARLAMDAPADAALIAMSLRCRSRRNPRTFPSSAASIARLRLRTTPCSALTRASTA